MATVDMQVLKELRAATNAPLKDCKQALEENNNDFDKASEWLKQKWIMKAASKADRVTKEWIVLVKSFGNKTVWLKLACETDFVARNTTFRWLGEEVLELLSTSSPIDSLQDLDGLLKQRIDDLLKENFVAIGENMQVVDVFVKEWTSYSYVHPGDKLVATVFYVWDEQVAKEVAMQIAAMNPLYLSIDDVPLSLRDELLQRFRDEVTGSWKPAEIVEKIVEGKLMKEYADLVLLEQVSILDEWKKVKERLWDTVIHGYVRFAIW